MQTSPCRCEYHAGQEYLASLPTQDANPARAALRWWFKAARRAFHDRVPQAGSRHRDFTNGCFSSTADSKRPTGVVSTAPSSGVSRDPGSAAARRSDPPGLAKEDLGGADWERGLIQAARRKGLLYRTETTYREWAVRFARFMRPRSPYAATGADIGAFLSELAVQWRASPATQRQALNALVFLLREGLNREPGEIDFQRAPPKERVPTVLGREECRQLFLHLPGTTRLMAELAYGAGLRLMELLRLRVHHLDIERQQLRVLGGKGDKDRVTVLPASLVPALREQVERLRGLFAQDRANQLPGVWLPEGLARKYPKAGVSWEWQWLLCPLRPRGARSDTLCFAPGQLLTQAAT